MRIDKLTFWCESCSDFHDMDISEIACPHYVQRLEKRNDELTADNDRLQSIVDNMAIAAADEAFRNEQPATPQA